MSVNGNNLTSTGSGWNTAGAVSTQTIDADEGYAEFTATETNTYRVLGLSHGDTNQNYTDIDYAIDLTNDGQIYIYEAGVGRGYFGSYTTGDVLRIAVEGGVVKYRKNGALLYTSTTAPAYPLLVDTSLYNHGSTLNNVMISTAGSGWVYTQQSYDWKGRPLVTTNTDGTQKYASYDGCGCAGGEMVTLTDEMNRKQKVYSDALGRQVKAEIMNGNSIYSTTTNTLNARDQVTNVRVTDSATSNYQDTAMSYDGYGRLWTKHVPEQDAGTNTVYEYNPDDTVLSVTDARNATCTYGYNGRHQVTSATHTLSGQPTIALGYGYDAAGNRTSTTDGAGSTSYHYDQLSRMDWEERTFTGLGSYRLSYGYNLANELTTLSLPFNSQEIDYSYDSVGRLSGVTGSGFNATYYAYPNQYTQSVPTFASNIGYRAWGVRKSMTYGNTVSDSVSYNSRLQPTSYTLNNVNYTNTSLYPPYPNYSSMSWNFDYYDDGRLHHAWDTTNNWFDRSYSYDHVARVSEASTYRRAEGLAPFPSNPYADPYQQTNKYDVWGNITNASGTLYASPQSDSGTYTNNRRSGLNYDADGRATNDLSYQHEFDGTGQTSHSVALSLVGDGVNHPYEPALDITQTFDGDGRPSKRLQVSRKPGLVDENGNQSEPIVDTATSYFVSSSVLGGEVVADIGRGEVSIYAGGERIAKAVAGNVTFEHHNPATGSWVTSHGHSSYRTTDRHESDPSGADVPLSTPYGGYVNMKWGQNLFLEDGDPFDYRGGCQLDGMPVACSFRNRLIEAGAVRTEYPGMNVPDPNQSPYDPRGTRWVPRSEPVRDHGLGIYEIWMPSPFRGNDAHHFLGGWVVYAPENRTSVTDQQLRSAVDDCTRKLYAIALKDFQPSSRGENGSFQGTDYSGNRGPEDSNVSVVNDVKTFNARQLASLDRKLGGHPSPIIDVHLHCYSSDPRWNERTPNPVTDQPLTATNEPAHMAETLAEMRKYNIVKGVISGDYDAALRWSAAAPNRFLIGYSFDDVAKADLDFIRREHAATPR